METVKVLSNRSSRINRGASLKTKTMIVLVLAVFAGFLSAVALSTPVGHAMAGSLYGTVYWVDQYGNMHPMSWAEITAEGETTMTATTTDGSYAMWLPAGTYTVTASSGPAFYPDSAENVVISPGSSTSIDFTLQPTGEPIPELPPWAQPLILLTALSITVITVRRYRRRTQ